MNTDLGSELREYRALTFTLIVGIALSVAAFVYVLMADMAERRGDLRVQASLYALQVESGLKSAISAITREIDYPRLIAALEPGAGAATAVDPASELDVDIRPRQACVLRTGSADPLFRLDERRPCPVDVAAPGPGDAVATIAGRVQGSVRFETANDRLDEAQALLAIQAAPGVRVLFELPMRELLSRADAVVEDDFHTAAVTCLYVGHDGTRTALGCTKDRASPYQPDGTSPVETPGADVIEHAFSLDGLRVRVASALLPYSVASAISLYPIAALLFFLFITAVSGMFVYKTTAAGIRLRRQQSAINRALDAVRKRNEELEQFSYMASHDLQTPVRHVITRATMMLEELDSGDETEVRRNAELILEAGERMHRLVLDLLEFCRAGQSDLKIEPVDMGELFTRKVEMVRDANQTVGMHVRIGKLPTIETDESRVSQLIQNLLANAVRFRRPDASLTIDVSAEWNQASAMWTFFVRDNGIGIAADQLERIFLPFKQLDTERRKTGTGIGLSIAKKVAERLGGTIGVESVPGRGSSFYFSLPRVYTGLEDDQLVDRTAN